VNNAKCALFSCHITSGLYLVERPPLVVEVDHQLLFIVVDGQLVEHSTPLDWITNKLKPLM
jgi:hypothetical protein